MSDYPLAICNASMQDVINNRTCGASQEPCGADVDVVAAPTGGGYAYKCDLTGDANQARFTVSANSPQFYGESYPTPEWFIYDIYVTGTEVGAAVVDDWTFTIPITLKRRADGKLEAFWSGISWKVGTAVLSKTTRYRVKVCLDRPSGGVGAWDWRIRVWIDESAVADIDTSDDLKTSASITGYLWRKGENLAGGVNRGVTLYFMQVSMWGQVLDPGWPKVATLTVDGAGTYEEWTNGSYEDVDELPPDGDTTIIETATASQKESVTLVSCSSVSIPSDAIILGVRIYAWHRKIDIENKTWLGTAFWKLGATEVDGKGVEPGETYCELCDLATPGDNLRRLNPDSNGWSQADVDALEIGVRSLASHGDTWKVSSLLADVAWTPPRRVFVQVV